MPPFENLVVLGATSAIAQATAREVASRGGSLFLVARDAAKLESVAADLRARGARLVASMTADLRQPSLHGPIVTGAREALGRIDAVLIAYGSLPNQLEAERDPLQLLVEFETNCTSVLSLLTLFATELESHRAGTLAVIGSVAGDRGRRSNYIYGAAKGAVDLFVAGLRARMSERGVSVVLIKPGYVDTPMTASIRKNALFATPQYVGRRIHRAMLKGSGVVYVPWFWRWIMLIIKLVPERLFVRLNL